MLKSTTLKREEKITFSCEWGEGVRQGSGQLSGCHGAHRVPHAVCPDRFLFLGQSRSVAPEPGDLRFKLSPRPLTPGAVSFTCETGVTKTPPSEVRGGIK